MYNEINSVSVETLWKTGPMMVSTVKLLSVSTWLWLLFLSLCNLRPGVHLLLHTPPSLIPPSAASLLQHGGSGWISVQTAQLQNPARVPHRHRHALPHLTLPAARRRLPPAPSRRLLLFPGEGHEGQERLTGQIPGQSKWQFQPGVLHISVFISL